MRKSTHLRIWGCVFYFKQKKKAIKKIIQMLKFAVKKTVFCQIQLIWDFSKWPIKRLKRTRYLNYFHKLWPHAREAFQLWFPGTAQLFESILGQFFWGSVCNSSPITGGTHGRWSNPGVDSLTTLHQDCCNSTASDRRRATGTCSTAELCFLW